MVVVDLLAHRKGLFGSTAEVVFIGVAMALAFVLVILWTARAVSRSEAGRRRTEAELEAILAGSPTAIFVKELDGRYRRINDAGAAMVGLTVETMRGRFDHEIFEAPLAAEIAAEDRRVAAGERIVIERNLPDGRNWVSAKFPLRDPDGTVDAIGGVTTDVTAQRIAETRGLLASLVSSATDGIFAMDADGLIVSWNRGAEQIFRYGEEEVVGRPTTTLLSPDNDLASRVRLGDEISDLETLCQRADGTIFPVSATLSPVIDPNGKLVGSSVIVRDITTRKGLEEQLRQAQKMETLGQLAGAVAHDFNNLLFAISGFATFARERASELAPEAVKSIDQVLTAAERATTLTGRLLAFSRKGQLERTRTDLNAIVAETEKLVAPLLSGVQLRTDRAPGTLDVIADESELSQILVNLIVNARDASEGPGGRVTVRTAVVDGHVELVVADNGSGMDADTQEKIFEPFFTTKEPGKGTGLGLSTVFGAVKELAGTIVVESELGVGTTFRITLPRAV
jgi:two-component system cell cycle sensor histidine kinase/response regulator CckA